MAQSIPFIMHYALHPPFWREERTLFSLLAPRSRSRGLPAPLFPPAARPPRGVQAPVCPPCSWSTGGRVGSFPTHRILLFIRNSASCSTVRALFLPSLEFQIVFCTRTLLSIPSPFFSAVMSLLGRKDNREFNLFSVISRVLILPLYRHQVDVHELSFVQSHRIETITAQLPLSIYLILPSHCTFVESHQASASEIF